MNSPRGSDLEGPESPNKQKQQGKNPFSGPLPGSLTRKEAILILNMSERYVFYR